MNGFKNQYFVCEACGVETLEADNPGCPCMGQLTTKFDHKKVVELKKKKKEEDK